MIREAGQPKRAGRRNLFLLAKGSVSIALIYWILRRTDLPEVWHALGQADPGLLLAAFLLAFAGYYARVGRWSVLLRVQEVNATWPFLLQSCLVGAFFSNFLPTLIGGDAVRAYDSWRLSGSKAGAFTVILVDRFLGILVLIAFALGAFLLSPRWSASIPSLSFWMPVSLIGGAVLFWIVFFPSRRLMGRYDGLSHDLRRRLDQWVEAWQSFRGRRDAIILGLGFSVLLQVTVILHYYLIARALHLSVPLEELFLIVPLAVFIMMVPISINAIGVRENTFIFFLAGFGVTPAEALAFSWVAYGALIAQGLLGGIVYLLRQETLLTAGTGREGERGRT